MKSRDLRLLVLHVSTRCDQTCAHCSIWRPSPSGSGAGDWGVSDRLRVLEEGRALGATTVLFTGGEPLLCDHIEALARRARALGLLVHLATNGLGLARAASWLVESVDEVFVSFEGPSRIHDRVRGGGMAARLRASVAAVRALSARPRLVARCALSALNAESIEETVEAAREAGFDAISFLPIDTSSEAFGGRPHERVALRVGPSQLATLRRGILYLAAAGELERFVLESEDKLQSIADALEDGDRQASPRCNAPEWSLVVEADGAVRPCFFQPIVATGHEASLEEIRNSAAWTGSLATLGGGNETCAACVCPKYVELDSPVMTRRAARAIGSMLPGWAGRAGAA